MKKEINGRVRKNDKVIVDMSKNKGQEVKQFLEIINCEREQIPDEWKTVFVVSCYGKRNTSIE